MKRNLIFAMLAFMSALTCTKSAKSDVVYDAYNGVSSFTAPTPFAPRILDFVTLDQVGTLELDGLRLGFTVQDTPNPLPQPMVVFVQFWDNVDAGSADPLANAVSLGTQGINFGDQLNTGGFGGGISTGLADNGNDIFLPGGTQIGVEFRFRADGSTFQPNVSGRLVDAPNLIGATSADYYIDTGLDGFDAADLVSKGGQVLRLELATLAVPEPGSLAVSVLMFTAIAVRRRRI